MLQGIHHVAMRCNNAEETIDFYCGKLGLTHIAAVGDDYVPSTGEFSPHINLFLGLEDGSMLDFVEVPLSEQAQNDANTPAWVKHIALRAGGLETLMSVKATMESAGIDVLGPTEHGFCRSIYFSDPSGHRVELAWDSKPELLAALQKNASGNLKSWTAKKAAGWQKD